MNERITALAALSRQQDLYAPSVTPEYDPLDLALPEAVFNAKRISDYILAQSVYLTDDNRFTGMLRFSWDLCVPADIFQRIGHKHFWTAVDKFYHPHYRDNLLVFEWQHSAPNYQRIIEQGIDGVLENIAHYKQVYQYDRERAEFLQAEEMVCHTLIAWAEKCALAHEQAAKTCRDEKRKQELLDLARICRHVPRRPARTFHEGLQTILFCFQCLPDSIGTIDRALLPLYEKDIREGVITRDEARELLCEVFIHLSNYTVPGSGNSDRSAECHFAIGGYTERGEDGFTYLSRLITEALMSIDTRRPAISLRWTKKTPFEVLKFMLDCERNDKNKRFAFVSDEPRIKALTSICGMSFSEAVRYTMCGCNEPAFPGAMWLGGETVNIVRCLESVLYNRTEEAVQCKTFDEFYALLRDEMAKDLDVILHYHDLFSDMRYKDINVLSAFLLDGCIENAKSPTQYGCKTAIGGFSMMGITCLIDSLTVIRQFVFDEERTTMQHLIDVMKSDWAEDEKLHTEIMKTAKFFGNNEPLSNEMARRFTTDLREMTKHRRLKNGAPILIGTLAGYNPHHTNYGMRTKATPDGRYAGEGFMVGTGQINGKDRKGLSALMASLAQMDPTCVLCGPNVCNMMIDGALMKNDEYFDKVCRMIETYFTLGGLHVQLNYLTKEELLEARKAPEKHRNLKVRVSGYSASFVDLPEGHQSEILMRTVQKG